MKTEPVLVTKDHLVVAYVSALLDNAKLERFQKELADKTYGCKATIVVSDAIHIESVPVAPVLLVRISKNVGPDEMEMLRRTLQEGLRIPGIDFIAVREGVPLEAIDELTMARAGWVRARTS